VVDRLNIPNAALFGGEKIVDKFGKPVDKEYLDEQ